MSINGITYGPAQTRIDVARTPDAARTRPDQARTLPGAPAAGASTPTAPVARGAEGAGGIPAEPPPGTDPALWSVLTAEERGFFARMGAMGPLTYGRMAAGTAAAPALRGGRLDVKV